MRRNFRLRSLFGFNLIGVAIAASILSLVGMGTISTVISSVKLDSVSRDRNLAVRAAQAEFENIQLMDKTTFLQNFDLSNVGVLSGDFPVPGLIPQQDSSGNDLPSIGFIYVTVPPKFLLSPNGSEIFNVYIEVRYRNRFVGDITQKFSLIVTPPASF